MFVYLTLLFVTLNTIVVTKTTFPYCFQFTWVGPYTDKANIAGLTCASLREDLTTIPCRTPLVATDNDKVPDTVALWQKHHNEPDLYGCRLKPGESCVKYTYIYNKGIQNITYMCAKVNATRGCYHQKYISGTEVEVCVCQSAVGAIPCNYGSRVQQSIGIFLASIILALLYVATKVS